MSPLKASAIACSSPIEVQRGLQLALVCGVRRSHPEHAPGRGPREREEEEHTVRAEEGMRDVALQVAVHLQVAEDEGLRVGGALEGDPDAPCRTLLWAPSQPTR